MDFTKLCSSIVTRSPESIVLSIFQKGELFLSPYKSIVQMRPAFEHMDRAEKRKVMDSAKEETQGMKQIMSKALAWAKWWR